MQEKYGDVRIADTGIREATILGQGIGMAMRGLRPIAEIQYLDYILYCLQGMSDDLATVTLQNKRRSESSINHQNKRSQIRRSSGIQVLQWREFLTFQKEFCIGSKKLN
jgi:pyruvate/2-oxoglutarate/acetoin dehydrogenase E1 component